MLRSNNVLSPIAQYQTAINYSPIKWAPDQIFLFNHNFYKHKLNPVLGQWKPEHNLVNIQLYRQTIDLLKNLKKY